MSTDVNDLPSSVIKKFVYDYPLRFVVSVICFIAFMYCVIAPHSLKSMTGWVFFGILMVFIIGCTVGTTFNQITDRFNALDLAQQFMSGGFIASSIFTFFLFILLILTPVLLANFKSVSSTN